MELNSEGYRPLKLRHEDKCSDCGLELSAGTKALWNPSKRIVMCLEHEGTQVESTYQETLDTIGEKAIPEPMAYAKGKAGASAMAEHNHRAKAREERVIARSPRIGKLLLAFYDDPQSTKVWKIGAEGEIAIGRQLDSLAKKYKFLTIHDRLIPRSRANIDHIAITQSGVIVIDTKNYQGTIQIKDESGFFSAPDPQLWVGRRNCMKLITGMKHQVEIVKDILDKNKIEVPVVGVLAFYAATWNTYKFMRKQEEIDGVLINSKGIEPIVARQGTINGDQIEKITRLLATQLNPAVQK